MGFVHLPPPFKKKKTHFKETSKEKIRKSGMSWQTLYLLRESGLEAKKVRNCYKETFLHIGKSVTVARAI